ncbi:hypothetical protein Pan216_30940 [Planctomycetes bacterium Pan216]|uniref:DUF1501 domain-containing protein n=1 Tax=Kolteria novifilia TaxID=2527975 RepID=A0A518B5H2_9BACT|nr:hypothetical protein Pan216_30940 [Planctomycetes bacterium Pan216]
MESLSRRHFLGTLSLASFGWWTSRALAGAERLSAGPSRPKSLIILWLDGGPSQLETFDPHPGTTIGGPGKAVATSLAGAQFSELLPRLAEEASSLSVIRSMVSAEGDHARGRYFLKTGYRPNPSVAYPSLGSICASELPEAEGALPPYITFMSGREALGGGDLGETYDPFRVWDPIHPPQDVVRRVAPGRMNRRLRSLELIDGNVRRGRRSREALALRREQFDNALALMDSPQLDAFKIEEEPARTREAYGETPFGRSCLAARRLVESGARAVEVKLGGWDTHANNFDLHKPLCESLDAGFSSLLRDLRERDMLDSTLVLCAGEFGRTPKINGLDGRDHWPKGFSVAMAGGGIRPGQVIGATDPEGTKSPTDPVQVSDLFATVLTALAIDPAVEFVTRDGRPIRLSEGTPLERLLAT